ncbi:FkbM family methyltransferase [Francisella hispaniensis]|uniref:FkbM family methyltransferase n=1 Tax=Francisella hispaniensis TaxID=622488 RepID=F4BGJ6_9GAMM|nr:FkbM family methyltransferase [Francisella hispaniensis]AEE26590.1 FkbM family methyltransferase [Francisella hispaniensis]
MLGLIYSIYRKLFARRCFIKLNKFLYYCSIRGLGIYNYENMNVSGENSFIQKIIKKNAIGKKKFVVFDIGANKGEYTKFLAENISNSSIFAFEPHPLTFKVLSKKCSCLNDIILFNCALAAEKSILKLYDYKSKDGSSHASLSSKVFTDVHGSKTISHQVDVTTVDLICEENNIKRIDLLKIDVEGYELDVLRGSKRMIQSDLVKFIQFEFTQLNTSTRVFFKDFWEILSEKYRIYRLLPNSLLEIKEYNPSDNEIFGYQNFIAIHKDVKNAI